MNTLSQYNEVLTRCRDLFMQKAADYGTAWSILRPASLTDQLYIKAMRIRTVQEKGEQKVADSLEDDFIGLLNYSLMALIQLERAGKEDLLIPLSAEKAAELYGAHQAQVRALMLQKNHDYGEAWRDMRISSMTDLILVKLLRIKQIEDQDGQTLVSEGLAANYSDIANYAVFCLILMNEK